MRMILYDFLRVLKSIWFYIAFATTVVSLWMDLGPDSYWVLHGDIMDPMEMLAKALSGSGSALSLPLLASLPCSANAFLELSSGAVRMAVFRSGRTAFISSKLLDDFCCCTVPAIRGAFVYRDAAGYRSRYGISVPGTMLLARLLSAIVFSIVGGTGALLSGDAVSAIAVPTAMSFALFMLSARFFVGVRFIDPMSWLTGEADTILSLCIFISAVAALFAVVIRREMLRYV